MQSFNFGLRQSAVDSLDDGRNRYAASSIYSGPGPAEDSRVPSMASTYVPNNLRGPFQEQTPRLNPSNFAQSRSSSMLNVSDPVAMHLLMETAIGDSKEFEILSYEELDRLKKEQKILSSRVDATKRKLALESKMRDAAQSLNRLYSTKGRTANQEPNTDGPTQKPKNKRRSLLGSLGGNNDITSRADDEYLASNKKIEEYIQELAGLEKRLEETRKRILEHTAGVLQMTHKGLKKNTRRGDLPRSPESMVSQARRSVSGLDGIEDFDERSLYQVPEYVTEFGQSPASLMNGKRRSRDVPPLDDFADRLLNLNKQLHSMIVHAGPQEQFDPPPHPADHDYSGRVGAQIQAHLHYLSQGLNAMEAVQARNVADAQQTIFDSEEQLEDVNGRLHELLERTTSTSQSPVPLQEQPRGKDIHSQLAFSTEVLDRLNKRVEALVEQKDILTRQIQQQRDLNSKSDAQRDAQIRELGDKLSETQRLHGLGEQEAQTSRDRINLLMEQLDHAKQENVLKEQQQGQKDNSVLEAEREARRAQDATIAELSQAKGRADEELQHARSEMERLESEVVRVQTEMTLVKAELDGAYGTRAQRAADVSMNPAIQKEIDGLSSRNQELEKELKDTVEDYEVMTKQSIEAEKERDHLEEKIDTLEQKCEGLESQLNDEKIKWLGAKQNAPAETTSTMVLKNEFKKMMRDTRAENIKTLRAEQEERRRLEALLRTTRKDSQHQTPVKSTNGQNISIEAQ